MRRVAVMAHYDVNGVLDPYLKPFISQLSDLCEKVILVSTSGAESEWVKQFDNVFVFQRDNVGYDFCSYRFGIEKIERLHAYNQLIVCNDSFYTSKDFSLKKLLADASNKSDVVGLTENNQFSYHLQSYFLVFNQCALHSKWFASFWSKVQPLKNKMQIIWRYEIGLSQTALQAGLKLAAIYQPLNNKVSRVKNRVVSRLFGATNPTHLNATKIASAIGVAKVDLFRLGLSAKETSALVRKNDFDFSLITNHVNRTRSYYSRQTLSSDQKSISCSIFDYVVESGTKNKVAVVLHLYHVELAREIASYLESIPENFDLYISICDYTHLEGVASFFSGKAQNLFITVTENRGRDVLPFVTILKNIDYFQYACILKIHSKKSTYSIKGDAWRQRIFKSLLPNASQIQTLLTNFKSDTLLGIVAPFESYLSNEIYWGANKDNMIYVMQRAFDVNNVELFFVGGTMFWFAPKALKLLIDSICLDDFEAEAGQQDGTMAHAFERAFTLAAVHSGFRCAAIEHMDAEISARDVHNNRVGVLRESVDSNGVTIIKNV